MLMQTGEAPVTFESLKPHLNDAANWDSIKKIYDDLWTEVDGWRPYFNLQMDVPIEYAIGEEIVEQRNQQHSRTDPCAHAALEAGQDEDAIELDAVVNRANEEFRKLSLFEICRMISPYNTPEKVCRYFGFDWRPYGEWKESFSGMRLGSFHGEDINAQIKSVNKRLQTGNVTSVFQFSNAHGEIVQNVFNASLQGPAGACKVWLPCTSWMMDWHSCDRHFLVPLPKRQILFNLNKLSEAKAEGKLKTVILTDSLKIADKNSENGRLDAIWTSWICDETAENPFEQVDWSPLKGVGPVYYLVTNHSGMSLADAYIKAYNLADFLKDSYDVSLRFIQAPVNFSRKGEPQGMECENFELIEEFDEFEKMYKKACESLTASVPPWYSKAIASAPQTVVSESVLDRLSKRHEALPYLLRPFITRGEISLLHAATGLGKSALAYTLSASVIGSEMPFQGRLESGVAVGDMKWWTVPPLKNGFRKVLYLDFELGQEMIDTYTKDYFLPYLPESKADREACLANFDVRDLRTDSTDYSKEENHAKILKMLEESGKKGNGRQVDMVVFDTYTRMAGGSEDIETWARINPLMTALREKGIAILTVHHSNKDGKPRGFMNKKDAFAAIAGMLREGDKPGTLEMPIEFNATKLRASCVGRDYDPFEIRFINGKWTVHNAELPAKGEFAEIVESYKKANYGRDAIAEMLGMGHDKCARLYKAGKAELKKLQLRKK